VIGDAPGAAAEHQDLDARVEDDAVGDARAVAAQRVVDLAGGQQRGDLDPQGFQDRRWQAAMGPPDEHRVCQLGEHHGWCLPFHLDDSWWLAFRHWIDRSEQQ
jgi:hypothetical protein